jgi:hypothetical protein
VVPGLRPGGGDPETVEIISWRFFMESEGWTIGLVSAFIAVAILTAVIAAFSMVTWVLGNV